MPTFEGYRPLFNAEKPEVDALDDPLKWVAEHLDSHPLVQAIAHQKNWTLAQTIAFYLMIIDSTACQLSLELLNAKFAEKRAVFVRPHGADNARCMNHPDAMIAPGEACRECVEDVVASRPDGMSEDDARKVIEEAVGVSTLEMAETTSSSSATH